MKLKNWISGSIFAPALAVPATASAQAVDQFYNGRDVKIVIGAGLGGSFGLYLQLAAKYIGKSIPGNPTVVVESRPGAGGMKNSGTGREEAFDDMISYTEEKAINVML